MVKRVDGLRCGLLRALHGTAGRPPQLGRPNNGRKPPLGAIRNAGAEEHPLTRLQVDGRRSLRKDDLGKRQLGPSTVRRARCYVQGLLEPLRDPLHVLIIELSHFLRIALSRECPLLDLTGEALTHACTRLGDRTVGVELEDLWRQRGYRLPHLVVESEHEFRAHSTLEEAPPTLLIGPIVVFAIRRRHGDESTAQNRRAYGRGVEVAHHVECTFEFLLLRLGALRLRQRGEVPKEAFNV
eukprot:scaffold21846_cov26-Tisochrysis_lutea.AAC.1